MDPALNKCSGYVAILQCHHKYSRRPHGHSRVHHRTHEAMAPLAGAVVLQWFYSGFTVVGPIAEILNTGRRWLYSGFTMVGVVLQWFYSG